jgi:predicted metal-dependent hydrolase
MAPLSVIDYVVVHELIHLEEKNHSKAFMDYVKNVITKYKDSKDWLERNGYLLRF